MTIRKSVAWAWGEVAQKAVESKYKQLGWFVIPTHAIETGGAPKLVGQIEAFVLPDMQIFKDKAGPRWVEVKFKNHCDKYQKKQQWQHGIDLPHWHAYLEVEQKTGIAGQLDILQFKPGNLADPEPVHLFQSLTELKRYVQILQTPHTSFRRGVAYFPMNSFRCSPITVDVPYDLPSLVKNLNPWEKKSKTGTAPAWEIKFTDKSPFEIERETPAQAEAQSPPLDLLTLVRKHGTYPEIPASAWAEYYRDMDEWKAEMRKPYEYYNAYNQKITRPGNY